MSHSSYWTMRFYFTLVIITGLEKSHQPNLCCASKISETMAESLPARREKHEVWTLRNVVFIKATDALISQRCTNFPNLFCQETLHVSGNSSAHNQDFSTVHSTLVYVMQVWWHIPVSNVQCHAGLMTYTSVECFSWRYNPLRLYFRSPEVGFSLLVFEVSWSHTKTCHIR